jgi:hypothetical protein
MNGIATISAWKHIDEIMRGVSKEKGHIVIELA